MVSPASTTAETHHGIVVTKTKARIKTKIRTNIGFISRLYHKQEPAKVNHLPYLFSTKTYLMENIFPGIRIYIFLKEL